jgi:hypothetical protein
MYKYPGGQILYMGKGLVLGVMVALAMLVSAQAADAQSSLVLRLRINNTNHMVYVPGVGEMDSGGMGSGTSYSSPEHFYLASYMAGLMVGLAGGSGQGLYTESGAGWHVIGFEQALGEPVYLAFSQGGWQVIDERMVDIESGEFMDYVSPSFAFGLGTYHPLKVALSYTGIDIEGGLALSRGIYKLVIENRGQSSGRPLVEVRNVGGQ